MIDGGIFVGRNPISGIALEAKKLEKFLDGKGVKAGVVASYRAIFHDFRRGNDDVLGLASSLNGRVVPAIVISPFAVEIKTAEVYLNKLKEQGARALFITQRPKYYDIALNNPTLRRILKLASTLGYIIIFGLESTKYLEQMAALTEGIRAPILVRFMGGGVYFGLADIINLGRERPGMFFDVGAITTVGGIRLLVERLGADRLFIASNVPEGQFFPSVFLLEAADLSLSERSKIQYGTLSSLFDLGYYETEPKVIRETQDLFGRPKIDTHYHLGTMNLMEPNASAEAGAAEFDRFAYTAVIVSSTLALNYDLVEGNAETFAWADRDPRVFGLIVIDPTRPDVSLREIRRWAFHRKAVGLKTIQDLYGMELDAPEYALILEANGNGNNLPVMAHIPGLRRAALDFPQTNFICAHSTWGRVREKIGLSNCWYDLATSHNDAAETDLYRLVKTAGPQHLLFGSDGPLISPAWTLGKLADSEMMPGTLRKILYENAFRAFPKLIVQGVKEE